MGNPGSTGYGGIAPLPPKESVGAGANKYRVVNKGTVRLYQRNINYIISPASPYNIADWIALWDNDDRGVGTDTQCPARRRIVYFNDLNTREFKVWWVTRRVLLI